MSIILYPHGGSENHGCEAIVRSTASILNGYNLKLFSMSPKQDLAVNLDRVCEVLNERNTINRLSFGYLSALLKYHILKDTNAFERLSFSPLLNTIHKDDILLSIGGDNYCYGKPTYIYLINEFCRKKGIKTYLWGCSIEPNAIDSQMRSDLSLYNHIIARESITFDSLRRLGLTNVSLIPDPAFQLKRKDLPLPKGFVEGNTVGINISPMIIDSEKRTGTTLQNYRTLIQYIINDTDFQVALIPHVVWDYNDDRIPLSLLYEEFKHTGRVILIEDHNAEELKGFIARCRFMIAARTHASIAAYSQKVPTLVIGYSVKARGIAKDIFGTYDKYVIPVQNLKESSELKDAFIWIMKQEKEIHKHYSLMMDEYIRQTDKMRDIIK